MARDYGRHVRTGPVEVPVTASADRTRYSSLPTDLSSSPFESALNDRSSTQAEAERLLSGSFQSKSGPMQHMLQCDLSHVI
jgi:hypothetical protein